MGKSPMAYHGHERSRHHNYSRNSQSRNRRSENQGFGPVNYIYAPDRFLRQLPPYRTGSQQRGPGSSQQYLKGRSYHNRPYSTARVRSPLVQKRLPPQRKRTRRDMHPPGESEVASKSSEQSAEVIKNENEPSSEGQQTEEDNSSNAVQATVPQTRSSTKAQQHKSEETTGTNKGEAEDGSGMSQSSSPQTRSSTKVQSKSEEILVPDKSENENSDGKIMRTTRGNSKVRNDDKSSSTVVHPTEERITGHNTRSATKTRLDVSDEPEQQEEGGNIAKTRKVRKDTRSTVADMGGDMESTESEDLAPVDTEKKTHTQDHLTESCQVSEDLVLEAAPATDQLAKETMKSEELETRNDKGASKILPNVKHLVGNISPRLVLSQVDTYAEKHREHSPEKGTKTTAASSDISEIKDSPRRSSRRGSSRMKIEEAQLPYRTPRRDHSRTPVHIQQSVEPREPDESFAASIRSISCRRSIRDSPSVLNIYDSFQKQRVVKQHVQVTVKKTDKEYLSGTNLDVSTEKSIDVTMESDETSVSRDKIGKRKADTLETTEKDEDHKKKCTLKSEQNSSVISAVSSPLQLLTQKPEPVSSSTPLKVVECCETVHMELSEESITDESVAYEKARDNISEQSLSFEKGAPVPEPICEPVSRKWCSIM